MKQDRESGLRSKSSGFSREVGSEPPAPAYDAFVTGRAAGQTGPFSVVIPAFNEEKRIPATIDAVHRHLSRRFVDPEIIVVDDGSADATAEIAGSVGCRIPGVRVIRHPVNQGKGAAVRTGILASRGEAILFSDADNSTPIEELDKLWVHLEAGADIVIASRALRDSKLEVRQGLARETMGRIFNKIVRLSGVRAISDTQCGFKLFRRKAAMLLFRPLRTSGWAFDVEILLRAQRRKLRIAEAPVRWINSADSRLHPVRHSFQMLREVIRLRFADLSTDASPGVEEACPVDPTSCGKGRRREKVGDE